jgi:hypothetical protein
MRIDLKPRHPLVPGEKQRRRKYLKRFYFKEILLSLKYKPRLDFIIDLRLL